MGGRLAPLARPASPYRPEDVIEAEGSALADPADLRRETHVPQNGEYWRAKKGSKKWSLRAGLVLLIDELRRVDGEIHSVSLAPHPTEKDRRYGWPVRTLILREFLAYFEFAPDGAEVRRAEIAQVQREADALQREIAQGPTPAEIRALGGSDLEKAAAEAQGSPGAALALPSGDRLGVGHTPLTALARSGGRAAIERGARVQGLLAAANVKWLEKRTATISKSASTMVAFYEEQGAAALARIKDFKDYAKGLQGGIATLGLYLGDGVEVETLCEGRSAPPEEKLALVQRRAYMDEEFAVHLVLSSGDDDGARWSDWDSFAAALGSDPALRDRVLPFPRCVVAMRYRREDARLDLAEVESAFKDGGLAAAFGAFDAFAEGKKNDDRTFLLVRDGENVRRVWSELSTDRAERLFPTDADKKKPFVEGGGRFRGVAESEITPDSVRYYEAREEYDRLMLFYRRLMVLMWGLHDRLGVFGDFYDPAEHGGFMSLSLQTERFRYVYDDETPALGEGRPTFEEWWNRMNSYLAPGSRVLCYWRRMLTPARAPACAKFWYSGSGSHVQTTARPAEPLGVEVARRRGDGLFVEPQVRPVAKWSKRKSFDARVRLTTAGSGGDLEEGCDEDGDRSFLVLDAVAPEDVDFYVQSRAARRGYRRFVAIFLRAKAVLAADREREEPIRSRLALDAAAAFPEADARAIAGAVGEAVRLWRAGRKGAPLPAPDDSAHAKALEGLRALLHESLRGGRAHVGAAEAAIRADGREPLRLALDGRGRTVVYATTKPEEIPFAGLAYPWVRRAALTVARDGTGTLGAWSPALMHDEEASERLLHAWPESAGRALRRTASAPYDLRSAEALRETLDGAPDALHSVYRPTSAEVRSALHDVTRAIERAKGRHIRVPDVAIPLGIARRVVSHRHKDYDEERRVWTRSEPVYEYGVVALVENATGPLWHSGPEGEAGLRRFWSRYAQRPSVFWKEAEESRPRLSFVPLSGVEASGFASPFARGCGYVLAESRGRSVGKHAKGEAWGEALVEAYVGLSKMRRTKGGEDLPAAEAVWTAPGALDLIATLRRRAPRPVGRDPKEPSEEKGAEDAAHVEDGPSEDDEDFDDEDFGDD